MLKTFFGNLLMAALIASIHFAPEPVVRIADFLGWTYGLIVTPLLFIMGLVVIFKDEVHETHSKAIVEARETVRFLTLRRVLFRVGFVLVILAGVSVGWTTWAGWLAVGFALMLVGFYAVAVKADAVEAELKRLRASNVDLRDAIGAFRAEFMEHDGNACVPMRVWIDGMKPAYEKARADG